LVPIKSLEVEMFSYQNLSPNRRQFIDSAIKEIPDIQDQITRQQVMEVANKANINFPQWLIVPENQISRGIYNFPKPNSEHVFSSNYKETEEEIAQRIKDTYESLEELTKAVANQVINGLVIAGGAGLGKSYTVNKILTEVNEGEYGHVFWRGYIKPTHLYRMLWENRHKGQVIVLDDCDMWGDNTALNILKAALELKPSRQIGWGSEKEFIDEDGEIIPRYFHYEGSIIFLTNVPFRDMIMSGSKNSEHLKAIESRSLVLDLKIKTKQEYMIKIKQTIEQGLLDRFQLSQTEQDEIIEYMENNLDKLVEVSLRMVEKIASLYQTNNEKWQKLCNSVCLK
jgi:hypothetical protein